MLLDKKTHEKFIHFWISFFMCITSYSKFCKSKCNSSTLLFTCTINKHVFLTFPHTNSLSNNQIIAKTWSQVFGKKCGKNILIKSSYHLYNCYPASLNVTIFSAMKFFNRYNKNHIQT